MDTSTMGMRLDLQLNEVRCSIIQIDDEGQVFAAAVTQWEHPRFGALYNALGKPELFTSRARAFDALYDLVIAPPVLAHSGVQ